MRWAVLLVLAGCRQIFGIGEPGPLETDAPAHAIDAPRDGVTDGVTPPVDTLCNPNDPGLVGCWDFDGNLADSGPNQLDVTSAAPVNYLSGHIGQAVVTDNSDLNVADSHVLDVGKLTIEAWIYVATLPAAGARGAILDNNNQYAMYVESGGTLRCYTGLATADGTDVIQVQAWTHIACVSDGTKIHAYVNGVEVAIGVTGGIPTSGTTGLTLGSDNPSGTGSRFTGRLDAVRLYGRALTETEIRCAYNPHC